MVVDWIIEGLALVLLIVSIYVHVWGIKILKKYDIAGDIFKRFAQDLDNTWAIYKPSLESWKEMIDKNLEIPISEHMYHTVMNTLVSLGAKDMGKESQAKQNMALHGFAKIGRSLGKGLKKEIPAIESLSGLVGKGGGSGGGIESMIGSFFGVDLPPGALDMLNAANQPQQPTAKPKSKEDGFWKE